jgi:hypothetical protein
MHKGKQRPRPHEKANPKPTKKRLITTEHHDEQPHSEGNGDSKKRQHKNRHERESSGQQRARHREPVPEKGFSSPKTEAHDWTAQEAGSRRRKTHEKTKQETTTQQTKDRPRKDPQPKESKPATAAPHAGP